MNEAPNEVAPATSVPGWPIAFRREVTKALFGASPALGSGGDARMLQVNAVDAHDQVSPAGQQAPPIEVRPGHEALSPVHEEVEPSQQSPLRAASGGAPRLDPESTKPHSKAIGDREREKWRRHIAAHHIPFRKDCLKCVMAGALGLQHRRVSCPSMYSLAFDLTGPFKELGKDDKGGRYKYALVAGLRIPDIALPGGVPSQGVDSPNPKGVGSGSRHDPTQANDGMKTREDEESSEASWLNANLEPTSGVKHVSHQGAESDDEKESIVSWWEVPDLDELHDDAGEDETHQAVPGSGEAEYDIKGTSADGDLWDDALGVSDMSDPQFDEALEKLLFDGANKVLRFAVPVKSAADFGSTSRGDH